MTTDSWHASIDWTALSATIPGVDITGIELLDRDTFTRRLAEPLPA